MRITLKHEYRRNLPHYQKSDCPHFVTFTTLGNWVLPYRARDLVLRTCVNAAGRKIELHAAVVMPDHAHVIFTPLRNRDGDEFLLAEIMHFIKGFSARLINRIGSNRLGLARRIL